MYAILVSFQESGGGYIGMMPRTIPGHVLPPCAGSLRPWKLRALDSFGAVLTVDLSLPNIWALWAAR